MLYTILTRKPYGYTKIHPSLAVIRHYLNHIGRDDLLLCLPGYMSKKPKTLQAFANQFPLDENVHGNCNVHRCVFLAGMNGYQYVSGTAPTTICNYLNQYLYQNNIASASEYRLDHSKVILFLDEPYLPTTPLRNGEHLSLELIKDAIADKRIMVNAAFIGSSNLSHNTLTKVPPSGKGETDVFLISSRVADDQLIANAFAIREMDDGSYRDDVIDKGVISISKEFISGFDHDLNEFATKLLNSAN